MFRRYTWVGIRFIIGLIISAIVWKPLTVLTLTAYCGLDPRFNMGNGYEIWFPGYLVYISPTENIYDQLPNKLIYPETIDKVALSDDWIVGSTNKGWFAVNTTNNNVFYPLTDIPKLESKTNLDINKLNFLKEADLLPYEVRYPKAEKMVKRLKFFLIVFPFLIAFTPSICQLFWTYTIRRKSADK